MKKFVLAVAATATAVSLSACGSTPVAQPKTITKTVTPAPIVKTHTVTKTVTETPQSCRDALRYAEQATNLASKFAGATSKFPGLVQKAYEAGITQNDVEAMQVITGLHNGTRRFKQIAQKLSPVVDHYNTAAADCRSH